jgi:hypothetical protein
MARRIFGDTAITHLHNLICEEGIHCLRVKLKAESACGDTSIRYAPVLECVAGTTERETIQSTMNGLRSAVLLWNCVSTFKLSKILTMVHTRILNLGLPRFHSLPIISCRKIMQLFVKWVCSHPQVKEWRAHTDLRPIYWAVLSLDHSSRRLFKFWTRSYRVHAMKACRRSESIGPLMLNLSTKWRRHCA